MCATSIKTGMPLPQITPCPLVDRGYSAKLGVELSNKTEEIPHGLPTHIDFNVLQSQEYWVSENLQKGLIISLMFIILILVILRCLFN